MVTLERLIELKLASGASAPHRLRDLADVQDLIIRLGLPLTLATAWTPRCRRRIGTCGRKRASNGASRAIGLAKQSK